MTLQACLAVLPPHTTIQQLFAKLLFMCLTLWWAWPQDEYEDNDDNECAVTGKELGSLHLVAQLCLTLWDPMDCSLPTSSFPWGFSRQENWSGLPCPPPGDLAYPGIESRSPALLADS